jgi:hypothetical protein
MACGWQYKPKINIWSMKSAIMMPMRSMWVTKIWEEESLACTLAQCLQCTFRLRWEMPDVKGSAEWSRVLLLPNLGLDRINIFSLSHSSAKKR